MLGRLGTRLLNPSTRAAVVTMLWGRRHDIVRWGRALWLELRNPAGISPARLATIGKVLAAITSDKEVSEAPELRQVRLEGATVVLDVEPGWSRVGRLSDRLLSIKGVDQVMTQST